MLVKDKKMYHIHKIGKYDEIWQENNEIEVDDNYNSNFIYNILDIPAGVKLKNEKVIPVNDFIEEILKQMDTKEKILQLKNLSDEEFLRKGDYLYRTLYDSSVRLKNLALKNREESLEEVRKEKYPNLPSRYHSIWVCDKKQLEFWKKQLKEKSIIYEVLLNGNLFKSSDVFLPTDGEYKENQKKEAYTYWNPIFKIEEEEQKAEYIFQGKVKVLKKINDFDI